MREVSIFSNPVAAPGVCAKCGSQDNDWFVDLGFEAEMHKFDDSINLPTWFDGVVYLCCDCTNNLYTDLLRKFGQFEDDHYVRTNLHGYSRPELSDDSIFNGSESISDENSDDASGDNSEPEFTPTFTGPFSTTSI